MVDGSFRCLGAPQHIKDRYVCFSPRLFAVVRSDGVVPGGASPPEGAGDASAQGPALPCCPCCLLPRGQGHCGLGRAGRPWQSRDEDGQAVLQGCARGPGPGRGRRVLALEGLPGGRAAAGRRGCSRSTVTPKAPGPTPRAGAPGSASSCPLPAPCWNVSDFVISFYEYFMSQYNFLKTRCCLNCFQCLCFPFHLFNLFFISVHC